MATWRDVRRIALAMPGVVEERSRSENAAWLVNDKFFTWERPLRKSDLAALGKDAPSGPILGVRTSGLEMKDALLAHDPKVFFTTPHFDGYPAVLVRLEKISSATLKDVLVEGWLATAPKRVAAEFLNAKGKRDAPGRHPRKQ